MVANNGTLQIQGQQFNLPQGQINVGGLSIPFSANNYTQQITTATTTTITLPTGFAGALLIPSVATPPTTLKWGGNFVSPSVASLWSFDAANYPANVVVITTGATLLVTVQFF